MKELNRTNRLIIALIILAAIVIIGLLTLKEPETRFHIDLEEMAFIAGDREVKDFVLVKNDIALLNNEDHIIIDLRSPVAFRQAHPGGALNVPIQDLLIKESLEMIARYEALGTTIVLYGSDPGQANGAWMLLKQLGIKNLRIYSGQQPGLEQARFDYRQVTEKAGAPAAAGEKAPAPETIVPVRKNKKSKAEGGC